MNDLQHMACPVCGAIAPKRVTDNILQCQTCGTSDSASQFKRIDEPPLATGPVTGFVAQNVTLEDVMKLAAAFCCDVVPRVQRTECDHGVPYRYNCDECDNMPYSDAVTKMSDL